MGRFNPPAKASGFSTPTVDKLIKIGYDKIKTEWQIMQELGYDRIWDCGHLKYEWQTINKMK